MKVTGHSVNVHWDRRYPKAGTADLCPVQLSINIAGLQFKVGLKLYATREDFDKAMSGKGGGNEVKELRKEINGYLYRAKEILERLPNPTRPLFQRMFKSETDLFATNKTGITLHFESCIESLRNEERISTAESYRQALNSLKAFRAQIWFEDVDEAWLNSYCSHMKLNGRSMTTCQIYLRNLRAIFNKAIKDGYVSRRHYPFNDFVIGTSVKSKNVLYPEQVKMLWDYEPQTLRERRARDYFFFCYLGNGMNFKDLAYMKRSSVRRDNLVFVREKTKRTNKVAGKEIRAHIHPEMQRIIDEWSIRDGEPNDYLFPILSGYEGAEAKEKRRGHIQQQVNDKLKIIGRRLGFEAPLLLNLARHSFSTSLKLSGTPVAFISDALGHADSATTAHYMKTIPDQHMKAISHSLLNF